MLSPFPFVVVDVILQLVREGVLCELLYDGVWSVLSGGCEDSVAARLRCGWFNFWLVYGKFSFKL